MPTEETPRNQAVSELSDQLYADYANYVKLETSVWDVKLLFGQLDQNPTPPVTDIRSAITLSWLAAKILAFYLVVNIKAIESTSGQINVPSELLPPDLPMPTPDQLQTSPNLLAVVSEMQAFRRQFFQLP